MRTWRLSALAACCLFSGTSFAQSPVVDTFNAFSDTLQLCADLSSGRTKAVCDIGSAAAGGGGAGLEIALDGERPLPVIGKAVIVEAAGVGGYAVAYVVCPVGKPLCGAAGRQAATWVADRALEKPVDPSTVFSPLPDTVTNEQRVAAATAPVAEVVSIDPALSETKYALGAWSVTETSDSVSAWSDVFYEAGPGGYSRFGFICGRDRQLTVAVQPFTQGEAVEALFVDGPDGPSGPDDPQWIRLSNNQVSGKAAQDIIQGYAAGYTKGILESGSEDDMVGGYITPKRETGMYFKMLGFRKIHTLMEQRCGPFGPAPAPVQTAEGADTQPELKQADSGIFADYKSFMKDLIPVERACEETIPGKSAKCGVADDERNMLTITYTNDTVRPTYKVELKVQPNSRGLSWFSSQFYKLGNAIGLDGTAIGKCTNLSAGAEFELMNFTAGGYDYSCGGSATIYTGQYVTVTVQPSNKF